MCQLEENLIGARVVEENKEVGKLIYNDEGGGYMLQDNIHETLIVCKSLLALKGDSRDD